ncbi:NHL repeat-containing protein [Ferruginibacter profundus]
MKKNKITGAQVCIVLLVIVIVQQNTGCKKARSEDTTPKNEKKWIVTTVAGNGTASFVNGPALSATFHFPADVAVNSNGIMYVTDILNFGIRKIENGGVSNFAGGSGFGIENGIGTAARFKHPYSMALDTDGNLFTSDDDDPRIRKLTPARGVSVYAGTETPGFADGDANTASFGQGNYLATDVNGNVYVSDAINNRIRRISVTGVVSTITGNTAGFRNGNIGVAQLSFPGGIAFDRQGNLYIADRGNFRIRKISTAGDVTTFAGCGKPGIADGNADSAKFSIDIRDLVIDGQGNVYLTDSDRIRKITREGIVSTIAGSTAGFLDADGEFAKFNFPNGLSIDAQGKIYVADLGNHRIRKLSFE